MDLDALRAGGGAWRPVEWRSAGIGENERETDRKGRGVDLSEE